MLKFYYIFYYYLSINYNLFTRYYLYYLLPLPLGPFFFACP